MNHKQGMLRVFLSSFMGAVITLFATGQYFLKLEIDSATIPDWKLIPELIISALIAGTIAVMNYAIVVLENGNGHAKDATDGHNQG